MRIKRLDLSFASAEYGLKPKVMESLGQFVTLAGPNGAGKSRLVRAVQTHLSNEWRVPETLAALSANVEHSERGARLAIRISDSDLEIWKAFVHAARCVEIDSEFRPNQIFEFLPKRADFSDHRKKVENTWQQEERSLKGSRGIENIANQAMSYLVRVARRAFSATHPNSTVEHADREEALRDCNHLYDVIEQLLGVRPEMDLDQQPTLFGWPIPDASLSDGQSLLLQMAVGLHAQGTNLDGAIVILDEPECHLHPAVVVEILERLKVGNPSGQIWIATHSVPLLAALPQESIWYLKDGEVSWAGRNPEIVLNGFLGGPDGREKVEEFLRLPAQFASHQFAAECLIPPKVANTGPDDPQAKQLREFLENAAERGSGKPLKILDFGAGYGRLLSAIHERWSGQGQFLDSISYFAYEPYADGPGDLAKQVAAIYGPDSGKHRVVEKRDRLSMLDKHSPRDGEQGAMLGHRWCQGMVSRGRCLGIGGASGCRPGSDAWASVVPREGGQGAMPERGWCLGVAHAAGAGPEPVG